MTGRSVVRHRLAPPVAVTVIGLTLIGLGQVLPHRHSMENDLTERSSAALRAAGLSDVDVRFSGRDATITGPDSPGLAERATKSVAAVTGVRVVSSELTEPEPNETKAGSPQVGPGEVGPTSWGPPVPVGFSLRNAKITVTGTAPSDADRTAVLDATRAAHRDWTVIDRMAVDPSLRRPPPPVDRLPAVIRMLSQAPIDTDRLVIVYTADRVILRGTPPDAATELRLLKAAEATVPRSTDVMDGMDVR